MASLNILGFTCSYFGSLGQTWMQWDSPCLILFHLDRQKTELGLLGLQASRHALLSTWAAHVFYLHRLNFETSRLLLCKLDVFRTTLWDTSLQNSEPRRPRLLECKARRMTRSDSLAGFAPNLPPCLGCCCIHGNEVGAQRQDEPQATCIINFQGAGGTKELSFATPPS